MTRVIGFHTTVATTMILLLGLAPSPALTDGGRPPLRITPRHGGAAPMPARPTLTPEQLAEQERCIEETHRSRLLRARAIPTDPTARSEAVIRGPQTSLSMGGGAAAAPHRVSAPGDFSLYRSHILDDTETNNQTSSTNEPSVATNCETVFYTGNRYASVSADGGQTFTFVNPASFFPAYSGGFCCDQVAVYEPSRNLMLWWLQYARDANGENTVVLAVSTSNAVTQASPTQNQWCWYSLTPQDLGYAAGAWFDFPDMTVSDNFVYITTDVPGGSDAAICFRVDLDELAACATATFENFASPTAFLRPTQAATGTMYIGTHVDNNTMRLYKWPEADASPASVDRDIDAWVQGTFSAPSPDGTDWLNYGIPPLLAAWRGGGVLGFMWVSVQGGGFPWPNVRWVRFSEATLGVVNQGQVWNSDFAFAYPSASANDNGDVGGTIAFGGGGTSYPYPAFGAWLADDFNGDTMQPLELYTIAQSNAGPSGNRWGDYLSSRRNESYGQTWNATGFVLNGGQGGSSVDPYFLWFGRAEDAPQPPSLVCPNDLVVECTAHGGTPASDPAIAAFLGGATANDVCATVEVTNGAPPFFPLGPTVVTFTATSAIGFSSNCQATVNVVDTTDPIVHCPQNITVECVSHQGTPRDDVQLAPFFAAVSATDICDDSPALDDDAPDVFPLGETVVTFTATDESGNSSSCQAKVTVEDTTPPEVTLTLDKDLLWPPNHKLVPITATVKVTDICDPNPTFVLTSITSNEPENGLGDGDKPDDIQENADGTADLQFLLRSERSGNGTGRIYTITYTGMDGSGNTTAKQAYVRVPGELSGAALATTGFTPGGSGSAGRAMIGPTPQDPARPLPARTEFARVQPNPFRMVATLSFALAREESVDLSIYDLRGARVRTLAQGPMNAGRYERSWDGRDESGRRLGAGLYVVRFAAGSYERTLKLAMVR